MPPTAGLIGLPIAATTFQRYDESPERISDWERKGVEYGDAPARIPRLWNMALSYLSGPQQWGYQWANGNLRLPPPIIVNTNRTSLQSIAAGIQQKQYADTTGVPSIFVGWNPGS